MKHAPENYIENGGFINRLLFLFALPLLEKGNENYLEETDLSKLDDDKDMDIVYHRFLPHYQKEKEKGSSFLWICFTFVADKWIISSLLSFLSELVIIFFPFIIMHMIDWFHSDNTDGHDIYVLIVWVMVLIVISAIASKHGFRYTNLIHLDILFIFGKIFFDKLKKVSLKAHDKMDISKISNSVATDVQRIANMLISSRKLISTTLISAIYISMLYSKIGWISFVGILCLFLCFFLVFKMSKQMKKYSKLKFEKADERNTFIKNAISGIKMLKFNAWEDITYKRIDETRKEELKNSQMMVFTKIMMLGFTYFTPLFCSFMCILVYMLTVERKERSIGVLFYIIFIFNILKSNFVHFFGFFADWHESKVAFKRADEILSFPNQKDDDITDDNTEIGIGECKIEKGSFSYYSQEIIDLQKRFGEQNIPDHPELVLNDIDLEVKQGEFVAIVGEVGSGKSSLLKTLCKSLYSVEGKVMKNGKIGYIPQKSFVINASFKKNVLFGAPYVESKYNKTLKYCELLFDLERLAAGDETEIGERGINLSGGQKQRLSIARTVYTDCDIYLIDDCLSALDTDIGQKIFKKVLKGMIKDKTRIMVTHALQYLEKVDRVIFMNKGRIVGNSSYKDLLMNNSEFELFVNKNKQEQRPRKDKREEGLDREMEIRSQSSHDFSNNSLHSLGFKKGDGSIKERGKQNVDEKRFKGNVSFQVYKEYLVKCGKGLLIFNLLLFFYIIVIRLVADYWVSRWCRGKDGFTSQQYVIIHIMILVLTLFLIFISMRQWAINMTVNNYSIFDSFIRKVFKKKMEFFDTTPVGQLLNLSSHDTDQMDITQPVFFAFVILSIFQIIATIIVAVIGNISLLFIFLTLSSVIFYFGKMYLNSGIELLRLKQISLSPVISSLIELYNGAIFFRSFDCYDFIYEKYKKNTQQLATTSYSMYTITRFINLIIMFFSAIFVGFSLTLFTMGKVQDWNFVVKSPNAMAVTVSVTMSLPFSLSGLVITILNLIVYMGCIERLMYNVDDECLEERSGILELPNHWPQTGAIKAVNMSCRYRKNLPLVLQEISFDIKSGERIGIMGRTGSGKSTLMLALTRMIDLDSSNAGYLEIDGIDVSTISLVKHRRAITVIPQDPFLLKGTLRFNIDPYSLISDEKVIEVLQKALIWDSNLFNYREEEDKEDNIEDPMVTQQKKLNFFIENGGSNLSVGQRQLICIARSMVNKPKIVLMDEATANIDSNTDSSLQKMLRKEFKDSTIITIAHRIDTIINYDRLFVFDKGRLVEKGTLKELMIGETQFKKVIEELGEDFKQKIELLS